MEITVDGESSNVVHRNLFLIRAESADHAYEKAILLGRDSEASYTNPRGRDVTQRFRGVSKLDGLIDGDPDDGAELSFEEFRDVSPTEISNWIPSKENLRAFRGPDSRREFSPDYRSKDALLRAAELLRDEPSDS